MPELLDISLNEDNTIADEDIPLQRELDVSMGKGLIPQQPPPSILPPSTQISPDFYESPEEILSRPGTPEELDPLTGQLRETPETRQTREFFPALLAGETGAGFVKGLETGAGFLLTLDPEGRADVIEKNIPGAKRRKDEKGNLFIDFPNGTSAIINKPGFSLQDAVDLVFVSKLFTPAARAPGAIGALKGPGAAKGLGRALTAAGGAAGTEVLRQEASQALGARQPTALGEAGAAGVLGGVTEIAGPVVKSVSKIIPFGKLKKIRKQNLEAANAVESVLNTIGLPEKVETAPGKIRKLSQQAIEARKTIRKEAVDALYNEAKKDRRLIELPETRKLISDMKERFKPGGDIHSLIGKVEKKLIGEMPKGRFEVGVPKGVTTEHLHGSKLEIDKMLNKFGEDSLSNTERKLVSEIKDSFLKELGEANPLYEEARLEFIRQSPAVEELQKSVLGQIAELKDSQLKTVAKKLFDPKEANRPSIIKNSKKVIEEQDPQVWRDITRFEIEDRLAGMRENIEVLTTENFPSQIRKNLFGNNRERKILYAGLDPEQAKTFRFLELALAGREKKAAAPSLAKTGVNAAVRSYFSPMFASTGAARDLIFRQKSRVLIDVLNNPKWDPALKDIRKAGIASPEATSLLSNLLNRAEKSVKPALQAVRAMPEEKKE